MNIVLIGYRGTGKTQVATLLGQKLNKKVVSSDEVIEKYTKKTISQIVEMYGWGYFRDQEEQVIEEFSELDNFIIDCGGGAILRENNIINLKKNGTIILLQANANKRRKRR